MSQNEMSFKDYTPTFTLKNVDDFYFECEMDDRTMIIQAVDETSIQFDARFKYTRNCYSYTMTLGVYEYNIFKENNRQLDSIKSVIERTIVNCIFNYVDESMVNTIKECLGKDRYIKSIKSGETITVETNVYYFTVVMSRYNESDYVPYTYEQIFIFDCVKKQVYLKKEKLNNIFNHVFHPAKLTTCKIKIYESLTNNNFKCVIDNGLLGTVLCYSGNDLYVYDNTFGNITHHAGDLNVIGSIVLDIVRDVIKTEPSNAMKGYLEEYDIELETLTNDQLQMILIADY